MTYRETLDWMFAQLPMYQTKGRVAFNSKLDGILSFSSHLNHPHKKIKTIHIAGTNGKGSSSHMLASILQEAGYTVGLYTSPHLKDFRERIRINGQKIAKKKVIDFIQRNKAYFEGNKLSFFEMSVGMAFSFFETEKVDIAVIEVGLGGRLDSTNIIVPEVSLITNIGFDHTDLLGNTLAEIAYEKAGIIKEAIPVVISEFNEETAVVFKKKAEAVKAPIIFAEDLVYPAYAIGLLGNYQKKNVKGVLAVLAQLNGFTIEKHHIEHGLMKVVQNTGLMGRWQQIGDAPTIICDTAHNKEGLTVVLKQIEAQEFENLHFVIGFVKEKNVEEIVPLFPINARYYFCKPKIDRGLDAKKVHDVFGKKHRSGTVHKSVRQALARAKKNAGNKDFIFVGGSNFVVAEVL